MSDNIYESHNAMHLKIGITGSGQCRLGDFHNLLNEYLLQSVKICQNFNLETLVIADSSSQEWNKFNYLFYMVNFDSINDTGFIADIKKKISSFEDFRNHFFLIIDGCDAMEMDDDDDLVFLSDNDNKIFQKFEKSVSIITPNKAFHVFPISMDMVNIWKTISDDNSIINLSEQQINMLAPIILKKSKTSKMSLGDKKREIKAALKKINTDDKLTETGYTNLQNTFTKYFKLLHQKKVVCQNYLHCFNKIDIHNIQNLNLIMAETNEITFLKTELYEDLTKKISTIFSEKIKNYCDKSKNYVAINSYKPTSIDAYEHHKFLTQIMVIAKKYDMQNIMDLINNEIANVNNLIIEHHKKEVEKITDLDKISSLLEIFAGKDRNNLLGLFDKIKTYNKVMQENLEKMTKWIMFCDKCLKLGIPRDSVIELIGEIIMAKISQHNDINQTNKDLSVIYPQCLQVFLLTNLNKHFIFKKLYMYISCAIRYSGRNTFEHIKNITCEQYQSLLVLENKLLQLCSAPSDEQSQRMNLSEIDIVETFGCKSASSDKKLVPDKGVENKTGIIVTPVPKIQVVPPPPKPPASTLDSNSNKEIKPSENKVSENKVSETKILFDKKVKSDKNIKSDKKVKSDKLIDEFNSGTETSENDKDSSDDSDSTDSTEESKESKESESSSETKNKSTKQNNKKIPIPPPPVLNKKILDKKIISKKIQN